MIRYGRRYEIVPVMESLVEDDLFSESVLERHTHLPAGLICFVNNLGKDLQSRSCRGVCCPAAGVCDGVGTRYLREVPVLDGVELGTVRRVVHDKDFHPEVQPRRHPRPAEARPCGW